MRPIRSILIPVDFSPVSANAFRYALHLADQLDASVDLLNVLPDTDGSLISISLNAQLLDINKEKLARFFTKGLTAASVRLRHVPAVRTFVKNGYLRANILRHVAAEGTDLIVMGTGAEGHEVMTDILGSNTSRLVDKADCPVLVVPEDFEFRPLRSICFATDLTHIDAFHAGHVLKALRVFQPRLDFVHVQKKKEQDTTFNMDLLREVFDRPDTGIDTRFHVLADDEVAEELLDWAEATEADLVVMHRPRRTWLGRLFHSSNTREAVLESRLPLLILPQEAVGKESPEAASTATGAS